MSPDALSQRALDAQQQHVAERLHELDAAIRSGAEHRGLYIHGAVGRGKTWLCDRFFEQLPIAGKRRVHFHSFFRQLHESIWNSRMRAARADDPDGVPEAIARAVSPLLDGVTLLYFDEFHVHDSGNAALVHGVLSELFANRVTLLATSNYAPDELLPGPFHHVFDAGIDLLKTNLDVVELAGDTDHRYNESLAIGSGFARGHWLVPGTDAQLASIGLDRPMPGEKTSIQAGGHWFSPQRAGGGQLWFSFAELCGRPTSTADFLDWVGTYDTWVLTDVPSLETTSAQAAQRFANLIDVLCDRDATLHVLSTHPRERVFTGRRLPLDARRTASRLALLRAL